MGKKRKVSGRSARHDAPENSKSDSGKLGPIRTYEDIADSEDEFHANRDKVSFEDGNAKKRRRQEEEFLEPSDEEVLAYPSESEDEDEEIDENDLEDETDEKASRRPQLSPDAEGDDLNKDEQEEGWGSSKVNYYDADEIQTEADALEEETEARRLQQKRLQDMSEADFGFDEEDWRGGKGDDEGLAGDDEDRRTVTEILPQLEVTDSMGTEERLNILRTRYPEFEPLAKEFIELQPLQTEFGLGVEAARKGLTIVNGSVNGSVNGRGPTEEVTPLAVELKYQALTAYMGALSLYFALLTSPSNNGSGGDVAMSATELRSHPVMDSLVKCRELWNMMKDVQEEEGSEPAEFEEPAAKAVERFQPEQANGTPNGHNDERKLGKKRKSKKQAALETAQADAQQRRAERIRKNEEDLADLDSLVRPTKRGRLSRPTPENTVAKDEVRPQNGEEDDSDIGEDTHLSAHEAAEKARKKKTLRFYTSQIAQKSQRRDRAGKDIGGDVDVPHRERFKERQARLNAAAERRGKHINERNDRIDDFGSGSDPGDDDAAAGIRAEADADAAAYYNAVASAPNRAQKRAALQQPDGDASMSKYQAAPEQADGKRGITYAIEKNKGLTPKRKKDVRNPRVKKRTKYAEKQKKLGSTRQVYRGGEERGGYGGEKTGIKSGLIRSRKL
ncbi:MAG: hypothetical protein M4579_002625 [Chaenotheca gracillima]|nr:MAG: hypothetical protein M4579_002625 [Chaenotheca gracillima]